MLKNQHKAIVVAVCAFLCSCAYVHKPNAKIDTVAHRVSPNYMAVGHTDHVNAYIIGSHTIVEINNNALLLSVVDSDGKNVAYEKVGQYYRLDRILDRFTASTDGNLIEFTNTEQIKSTVFSSNDAEIETVKLKPINVKAVTYNQPVNNNEQLAAVLSLSKKQLLEVKESLTTAKSSFEVNQALIKLNTIDNNLKNFMPTVFVNYKSYDSKFTVDSNTSAILIEAAKLANEINITGYTNSINRGKRELKVSKARSENARDYLVNNCSEVLKFHTEH